MKDKELKKEKEELINALIGKINSINDEKTLKSIFSEVKKLNDKLDIHDSKFDNLIDAFTDAFKKKTKDKINQKLKDIFDKYDEMRRDGTSVYSDQEKKDIVGLLSTVNDICNRNFWDRFKRALRIGL